MFKKIGEWVAKQTHSVALRYASVLAAVAVIMVFKQNTVMAELSIVIISIGIVIVVIGKKSNPNNPSSKGDMGLALAMIGAGIVIQASLILQHISW